MLTGLSLSLTFTQGFSHALPFNIPALQTVLIWYVGLNFHLESWFKMQWWWMCVHTPTLSARAHIFVLLLSCRRQRLWLWEHTQTKYQVLLFFFFFYRLIWNHSLTELSKSCHRLLLNMFLPKFRCFPQGRQCIVLIADSKETLDFW